MYLKNTVAKINNAFIHHNKSFSNYGGLALIGGTTYLYHTDIFDNISESSGSGMYLSESDLKLYIMDLKVHNNQCTENLGKNIYNATNRAIEGPGKSWIIPATNNNDDFEF